MADIEQNISRMHQLLAARQTLQFLQGDRYDVTVAPWRDLIRRAMVQEGKPPLSAMLAVSKHRQDDMELLWLFAAAVDVIEQDMVATV